MLVTGAQGFVGSWLAERLLAEGADVVVPRRDSPTGSRFEAEGIDERCDVVEADVTDYDALVRVIHQYRVRAVFHLAGQSVAAVAERSPYSTWESNLRGTYTLLEACRAAREVGEGIERVVVASSASAYGGGERAFREDDALRAEAPYAVSKAAGDLIARSYARTFDLPVGLLRPGGVYGGGDPELTRLVPGACSALVDGDAPVIRSDGTPVRELVYVEDAVSAYLAVAESLDRAENRGRAWNAGGGEPLPVIEIVRKLIRASGRDVEPDVRGESGESSDRVELDSSAIRSELGWAPEWDLDRGLAATYAWYEALAG